MNHNIPQYDFYKHKYGDELLIDVVPLNTIKKYLKEQPVHILTYYDITLITSGEGEFLIDHQANRVKPQEIIFTPVSYISIRKDGLPSSVSTRKPMAASPS